MDVSRRAVLGAAVATAVRGATQPVPNVILVISDDQGFGDVSLHGNPVLKTPNLDRVGTEGVQFTQFHASPVCSPTRASLMTGRYNYRTGVVDTYLGRSMMYPDEVTLAEVFRRAGYRTGIFGKWHLGDCYPMRAMDQGFEHCLVHRGGGLGQPSDIPGGSYFDPMLLENGRVVKKRGYCTDVFFNSAMQFIERDRTPFFAYIATNAPHDPLEVDDRYVAPFRGLDERTAKTYGMIRNLDENMGRLLAKLEERELARDTILIFMTDNGPQRARYNAGMRGVKGSVYEGGIRVPFFMRWPRAIRPGTKIDRLAAHIDVMPTLLDACAVTGAARDLKMDGRSLVPLLRGAPAWSDRNLVFQWHRGDRPEAHRNAAIRNQRYKLVNGQELYDLQTDPVESTDISDENPDIVKSLRAEYERWFEDVSSTRGYEPSRISLGSPREQIVTLTRQDWRGPAAGWEPTSTGHWEVDVERSGNYELIVHSVPVADVTCRIGEITALSKGTPAKVTMQLPAGPARVEISVQVDGVVHGPNYVEVRRI